MTLYFAVKLSSLLSLWHIIALVKCVTVIRSSLGYIKYIDILLFSVLHNSQDDEHHTAF